MDSAEQKNAVGSGYLQWYPTPRHVGKTSLVDLSYSCSRFFVGLLGCFVRVNINDKQEESVPLIRIVLVRFANHSVSATLVLNITITT